MSLIVQKFGGSSVADADKLLQSAQLIRSAHDAGYDVIAVVSAIAYAIGSVIASVTAFVRCPAERIFGLKQGLAIGVTG